MSVFFQKNQHPLPQEVKRRLVTGLVLSILFHALILSLQLGVPGSGLPDIDLNWNKRRAEAPELQVQIAQLPTTSHAQISIGHPESAPVQAKNYPVQAPPENPPLLKAAQAPVLSEEHFEIQLVDPAPRKMAATERQDVLAHIAAKPKTKTKIRISLNPVKIQTHPPQPMTANAPDIVAVDGYRDDGFVVAVRHPDDMKKDSVPEAIVLPEPVASLAEPVTEPEVVASNNTEDKPLPERHQLQKAPSMAIETPEQKPVDTSAQKRLLNQVDTDNRKLIADAARQQAEDERQQQREQEELTRTVMKRVASIEFPRPVPDRLPQSGSQIVESLKPDPQTEAERRERERQERLQRLEAMQQQREQELERQQIQLAEAEKQKQAQEQAANQVIKQTTQQVTQQAAINQARQQALNQSAVSDANSLQGSAGAPVQASVARAGGNPADNAKGQIAAAIAGSALMSSDLANRAREQLRNRDLSNDVLSSTTLPRREQETRIRRHSVFGGVERDVQLRMYVDSWKQKIERNGNLNYSQTSREKARGDPLVTVLIRSDGSVEDVVILRSSGRADLDQAVKNIVRLNARYAAFPPAIAAQYDVIEIRRIWSFDDNLRILEELR
jgi:TonB family protein